MTPVTALATKPDSTPPATVAAPHACVACGSTEWHTMFHKQGYDFAECDSCGLAWLSPLPTVEQLDAHYSARAAAGNYDPSRSPERIASDTDILNFMNKHIGPRPSGRAPRIFDIGCLFGQFLDLAAEHGWETWGVELQQSAAESTEKRHPKRIFNNTVEGFDPAAHNLVGYFDVVVASGLIEHVRDPKAFFTLANTLLRPAGTLIIQTPNHGSVLRMAMGRFWPCYAAPEHTFYFSPKSLGWMASQYKFGAPAVQAHWKKLRVGYVLTMLQFFGSEIGKLVKPLRDHLPNWLQSIRLPFYGGEMLMKLTKKAD